MGKNQREIKYIGFYDLPASNFNRVAALPAVNKMDYICDALNRAGYSVHIVSPSWFGDNAKDKGFIKKTTIELGPNKRVTFCPSFGTKNKLSRNLKIIFTLIWLFFYLIRHTDRNEKILMYHTPWLSLPVRWSKRLKGFFLILEVEEIYADVSCIHPYFITLEKNLIEYSDYYILSTELLKKRINKDNKPFLVLNGAYEFHVKTENPPAEDKIHLLYSGIIDSHKAGAFNAVEASRFLSEKYVLHLIGFGEVEKLIKRVNELNLTNKCKILFDGLLSGKDYIKYCQRCHIGLNTQKMSGSYLETSFPSKILSYLGMGLRVVTCKIECVQKSLVNHLLVYYDEDSPESIARAILSIDLNSDFDSTGLLRELDRRFVEDIKLIFND